MNLRRTLSGRLVDDGRAALASLVAVQIAGGMLAQVLAYFAPQVTRAVEMSPDRIGYLLTCLTTATALSMAVGGRVADRFGRRNTFLIGAFASTLAGLGAAFADSLWQLVASITAYGLFWGTVLSAGAALSFLTAPPGRRGLFVAIRQQGLPAAALLTSLALPLAATMGGWRGVVIWQSGACLVCTMLCILLVPNGSRAHPGGSGGTGLAPVRLMVFGALAGAGQWAFIAFWPLFILSVGEIPSRWRLVALIAAPLAAGVARLLFGLMADRGHSLAWLLTLPVGIGAAGLLWVALTGGAVWSPTEAVVLSFVLGGTLLGWNGVYVLILSLGAGESSVASRVGSGLAAFRLGSIAGPPTFGAISSAMGWRSTWSLVVLPLALALLGIRRTTVSQM